MREASTATPSLYEDVATGKTKIPPEKVEPGAVWILRVHCWRGRSLGREGTCGGQNGRSLESKGVQDKTEWT